MTVRKRLRRIHAAAAVATVVALVAGLGTLIVTLALQRGREHSLSPGALTLMLGGVSFLATFLVQQHQSRYAQLRRARRTRARA